MKNKKIFGFVLLALIITLVPVGSARAKYKQTIDVGTVKLNITQPMPTTMLDPGWKEKLNGNTVNSLIVDSYNNQKNNLQNKTWDEGEAVGKKVNDNYTQGVKLFYFEDAAGDNSAYILAEDDRAVIFPENSSELFKNETIVSPGVPVVPSIGTAEFNSVNTSNVTDMSYMFQGCSWWEISGLNNFNTSKVTNMEGMFYDFSGNVKLDLSKFDTSSVENMSCMFQNSHPYQIDLSSFDTSKVTNMSNMFNGCELQIVTLGTLFFWCDLNDDTSWLPDAYEGHPWWYNSNGDECHPSDIAQGGHGTYYRDESLIESQLSSFSIQSQGGTITGTQTTSNQEE